MERHQNCPIAKRAAREYYIHSNIIWRCAMRVLRPGTYGSDVMEVQALLKKMNLG
jgi:hypothetical protein